MSKVILVASGKGGTGKTMFSVNMGAALARKGCRVMLLDMDMGMRNMDLYLGMENSVVYNIMDVITGVCRITKATIKVDGFETLYFMAAAPRKDDRDITPLHMEILCSKLKSIFDFIIIDCPAGVGDTLEASAAAADQAVIITEPVTAAMRDADVTERFLIDKGVNKTCIIANKVNVELMQAGLLPDLSMFNEIYSGPFLGYILEDDNIRISTNKGIPVVIKPGTYIERNFMDIIRRIISLK
ncbi:MAG: AAA family ATPase [Bacillota bacterium]|nr:AAA family ATPase [Bacillota bacterium]